MIADPPLVATEIYGRYRQKKDVAIVSQFLVEHLHDPAWREATLLLLANLKRKDATGQLNQILEGTIKSRRSQYVDIVQQDLFFIGSCLAEGIAVKKALAKQVVSQIGNLGKNSPFPSQRNEALKMLDSLSRAGQKQYASFARKELKTLATKDKGQDIALRIEAARILYLHSSEKPKARKRAAKNLLSIAQQPDLSFQEAMQTVWAFYHATPGESKENKRAARVLFALVRRPDASVKQVVQLAQNLWSASTAKEEQHLAPQILLELAQRSDLPFNEAILIAQTLYQISPDESEEQKQAAEITLSLAQRSDLAVEQAVQLAEFLYQRHPVELEERRQATQMLLKLAEQADLSFEQTIQIVWILYQTSSADSEERRQIDEMFLDFEGTNLSFEQATQAASILYQYGSSEARQLATQMLLKLAEQPDLTVEQILQLAQALSKISPFTSEEQRLATQMLLDLMMRSDLSIEQALEVAEALYRSHALKPEEREQATQLLWQLAHDQDVPIEQRLRAATVFLTVSDASYLDRAQAVQIVLALKGEEARQYLQQYWQALPVSVPPKKVDASDIPYIVELARQEMLPIGARDEMYRILREMVPQVASVDEASK